MRPEDIDQHIGRDNLVGVAVHHLQNLTDGRRRQAHSEPDIVKSVDFLFMLLIVDVHKEHQSVKLHYSIGLGF